MYADSTAMRADPTANVVVKHRKRARIVARIDGRTRTARRVAQLIEYFTAFFGGVDKCTPILRTNIQRAAELIALSENARSAALRAPVFDIENLTRLESTTDRAVRRLALPKEARDQIISRTLADILREGAS
jgi:hypothetical protein